MVLLLPLAMLAVQTKSITVSFRPTPAPKALELLSKVSGMRLAASPVLSDEVVMARLKDAPMDKVMSHLAEALCAKWDRRPDGISWLVPDQTALRRLDEAEAVENERHLLNSLKYVQRRLSEQPEELDQAAIDRFKSRKANAELKRKEAEAKKDYPHMFVMSPTEEESPAWRALARTILHSDPKSLLAIPNDAKVVWAEDPTPMQRPFMDDAQQALKKYRQEVSLLIPESIPKRIKITLTKWEYGSAINASFEAVDLNGKVFDTAFLRMNDDTELMKVALTDRPQPLAKEGEMPLVLSEEAREARIALSNEYNGKDKRQILQKWRPRLLDPVRFEPTEWDTGEDLVLAAEATDQNLIGSVHDLIGGRYAKLAKTSASQVIAKHNADFLPVKDGWLVFRSHERLDRVSRSEARGLIAESVRLGGVTVDSAAEFTAKTTRRWPFTNWLGDYLAVLLSGGGRYSAIATTLNDIDNRTWASLGRTTIDSLRRGDTIMLSKLTQEAKAQIAQDVYWHQGLDDGSVDPTDLLPNGISDGTLSMTIEEMPVFVGWHSTDGPPAVPSPIDAKTFGKYLAKGNTYEEIPAGTYRLYDRFRIGLNRAYVLHFSINPGAVPMTIKLGETFFAPDSQTLEDLPADIKTLVERSRQAELAKPANPPPG